MEELLIRNAQSYAARHQLRLAERAGISRPSIANVEAGRQNVSLRQLCALASALGVTVEELLSGGA